MNLNHKTPQHIYKIILSEVENILEKLTTESNNEKLSAAKNNAINILKQFQEKITSHIHHLEKNAEWDKFTIAFYGETNAGKSTIIETIRILMKESTKINDQKEFHSLKHRYGITEENIASLQQAVAQSDALMKEIERELKATQENNATDRAQLESKLQHIRNEIANKKRSASLWKKFIYLFNKIEEEIAYEKMQTALQARTIEHDSAIKEINKKHMAAQQQKISQQKELDEIGTESEKYKHLANFADGAIIGDGRPDFTRDAKSYTFEVGNKEISLLDVPGIEGEEIKVMDNIQSAVQKAHAVFYVTAKAAPPQKGDETSKGTLEKIKEHLGAQTEVWAIFNKRITNPMQLARGELVSQDEQASLDDLNRKMQEQLGNNFQNVITLSAQPAFLAAADCMLPGTQDSKNREKFLGKFDSQDLLQKSGMQTFVNLLKDSMANDYKEKIRRSNFNKADQVIKEAASELSKLQSESFQPLEVDLKQQTEYAKNQLDITLKSIKTRLESGAEEVINEFENSSRKKVYAHIENNISNDEFKEILEQCIEEQKNRLKSRLPKVFNDELKKFQDEIEKITSRFRECTSDLLKNYSDRQSSLLNGKFEFNINIDNGIQMKGLLAGLAGGALMAWNPGGWVVLTLGAISVLVSLGKALIGFFSSDYKMAQQRKSVDSNLDSMTGSMRESIQNNLAEAFIELEKKVIEIKDELTTPAHQVVQINASLAKSIVEFEKIALSA